MTFAPTFSQSPQARFKIMEQPGALPGACLACNGTYSPNPPVGRSWFVDLAIDIDYHGACYICNLCFEEIANTMSWLAPAVVFEIHDRIKALETDNFQLRLQLASLNELEQQVDSFIESRDERRRAALRRGSSPALPFDVRSGNQESSRSSGQGEGGSAGAENQSGTGDGTLDESGDGPRVDDVRPDESSHEFRLKF